MSGNVSLALHVDLFCLIEWLEFGLERVTKSVFIVAIRINQISQLIHLQLEVNRAGIKFNVN